MIPPELVMIRHVVRSADREILHVKISGELPWRLVPVWGLVRFVCVCETYKYIHRG